MFPCVSDSFLLVFQAAESSRCETAHQTRGPYLLKSGYVYLNANRRGVIVPLSELCVAPAMAESVIHELVINSFFEEVHSHCSDSTVNPLRGTMQTNCFSLNRNSSFHPPTKKEGDLFLCVHSSCLPPFRCTCGILEVEPKLHPPEKYEFSCSVTL